MIKRLDMESFMKEFRRYGRESQFSYEARGYIYDYLEGIDENMELNVIAICCDFVECESLEEFKEQYNENVETVQDAERWLSDRTSVVHCSEDCILFLAF